MPKPSRPIILAVVNDVHAGGATALAPDVVKLDDGGEYVASKAQRWLFNNWRTYWKAVDAARDAADAELYAVFNGDMVDGQVKGSTQIISANPNAQAAVVSEVLAIPLALKPDKLLIVRGTEAHVGNSASAEERIADGLRRDKRPIISDPDTGTASWWHWRACVGGIRLDVTHHGRIGQREHTRASQIALYAHDIFLAHTKAGEAAPHLALRGHNHKWADSYDACPTRVIGNGAWQLGTGYVHKVQPDSLADIGGLIVTIRNGEYDVTKIKFQPERPTWTP